jgi:hypothetical protein
LNDIEFLDAFHMNNLPGSEFRHRGHLRLAWLILNKHKHREAASILAREIKRFATAQGSAGRYHETLTRFWVHMVNHAKENASGARSIDELVEEFPILLDKNLPYKHWKSESFNSHEARAGWVPPDLFPMP